MKTEIIDTMASVTLGLFLAIAMMSLNLIELASAAVPMLVILAVQVTVMALFAWFILLIRQPHAPLIASTSAVADTPILFLLVVQLLLGVWSLFVSAQHLDGHEMTKFMSWAQGIFTFDPQAASYVGDVSWVFKAHIFLGLTIFLLFPFTRLVHIISAPVRFLWRPGYQIVRSRKRHPAE